MIYGRLVMYVAYVILGAVIIARTTSIARSWQTLPGLALGLLLIVAGIYKIALVLHARRISR